MRRFYIIPVILMAISVIGLLTPSTIAQITENKVTITVNLEMVDGHGGGNLTYELTGQAARDLRRAVLARYDNVYGGTSGVIDPQELRFTSMQGYIADVENFLTFTSVNGVSMSTFNPLHHGQGEVITVDAQGFVGVDLDDVYTPIKIYLYFDATGDPQNPDNDQWAEQFSNALYQYDPLSATSSSLFETGEISTNKYVFESHFNIDGGMPNDNNTSESNPDDWRQVITYLGITLIVCICLVAIVYIISRKQKGN